MLTGTQHTDSAVLSELDEIILQTGSARHPPRTRAPAAVSRASLGQSDVPLTMRSFLVRWMIGPNSRDKWISSSLQHVAVSHQASQASKARMAIRKRSGTLSLLCLARSSMFVRNLKEFHTLLHHIEPGRSSVLESRECGAGGGTRTAFERQVQLSGSSCA